jgi:hypothetical protein
MPSDIDLPLGTLVGSEWVGDVYVYTMGEAMLAITKEKNQTLESKSESKFKATAKTEEGQVKIPLPEGLARHYLWERKGQLYLIEHEGKDAILLIAEEEVKRDVPRQVPQLS